MKTSKVTDSRYLLPEKTTKKHFLETLKSSFIVKQTEQSSEDFAILDTFEWNLYHHHILAIRHEDHHISLWQQQDLFDPELALNIDNINTQTRFWWDFPDGEAKDYLQPIINLRSLNAVYQGILKIEHFSLQNDEGKILVFCQLLSMHDFAQPRLPILRQVRISPITGYHKENARAIALIKELGGFASSLAPLDSLLAALGLTPRSFTIKPQIKLDPALPARNAVSSIVTTMIAKQRLTESGIIKDIDTEFLHHYRVAIRMVRAAISQLKEVFPQADVIKLKQRFGDLARETNYLRDLDVFILNKTRYMNLLQESMRDDLLPMFNDFQKSRQTEARRISRRIASKAYRDEIDQLQALFSPTYSAMETPWSERPSIELAVNKILKTYKKIYKSSIKITATTADEEIHKIRIDCKKLRYLLYFFGSMFKPKKITIVAKHLKSLQDKLGVFNDLTVQGDFLKNYLYQLEHKPKKDIMLIASLGGLISSLYTMQVRERRKCINELAVFSEQSNRQLFFDTFTLAQQVSRKQIKGRKK